jgi:type I restriction enzyme S subunit
MSFPRYPEYKNSGVEWLGEVPVHWGISPLKRMLDIQNGSDHKHIQQDEGYPVIGSGGVFAYASEYVYDGESILLGRKGTIDRPLYVNEKFWTVDTMYWSKIRSGTHGKFAYYTALGIPFFYYSTNTALPSMTKGTLDTHLVCAPSEQEQIAIAAFLDRETTKIDTLIAEQEQLIALLKEKRQAVISHVVTKGLDPNVKMKDSGIEWLGEVPGHWEVLPLKYFASFSGGGTPSRENLSYWNGDIPWVSPKDMKSERIIGAEECITEFGLSNSSSSLLPVDRVLMVVRSGILQHTIPVAINDVPVALNQDMKAILFKDGSCLSDFFFRWVQGLNSVLLLAWAKQGATVESIEQAYLANTVFPLPPIKEQEAIIEFINQQVDMFDELTAEAVRGIELLKERRSALISAAVTGKIDVRTFNESHNANLK